MLIHAGSINRDHVHLLLSIPLNLSVSRAVQYLKGCSSHKLLSKFKSSRKRYWGQYLWARGYWVARSENVTDEVWAEYITTPVAKHRDWQDGLMHRQHGVWSSPITKFAHRRK